MSVSIVDSYVVPVWSDLVSEDDRQLLHELERRGMLDVLSAALVGFPGGNHLNLDWEARRGYSCVWLITPVRDRRPLDLLKPSTEAQDAR
jgi:hypothetical protein